MHSNSLKRRTKKAGLPPGTLVYTGSKKVDKAKISLVDYSEDTYEEKIVRDISECFPYKKKPSITWIDVEGVSDIEVIKKLGEEYGLHPLVEEDILNTDQRPKLEDFGDYLYIVLKMIFIDASKNVVSEQVSLLIGSNFVVSLQEGIEGDVFSQVRLRLKENKGKIRKEGSDYLAYTLIDSIVDNYFIILEDMGEKIESLEDEIISNPSNKTLKQIHEIKKWVLLQKKAVWPLREMIGDIQSLDSKLIKKSTILFLRDVDDHIIQAIDTLETYREILTNMTEIYLSKMSFKMNEVIKVLTVISLVFMPLTFIVGVYGMNFTNMPELHWKFGYFGVLAFMAVLSLGMIVYFKKVKWL